MEWINAKYDGECTECKRKTVVGERIYYSYAEKRAWCKECCEKENIREAQEQMAVSSEDNGPICRWELVYQNDTVMLCERRR